MSRSSSWLRVSAPPRCANRKLAARRRPNLQPRRLRYGAFGSERASVSPSIGWYRLVSPSKNKKMNEKSRRLHHRFMTKLHISLSSTCLWRRGPGRGDSLLPVPAAAGLVDENRRMCAVSPKIEMRLAGACLRCPKVDDKERRDGLMCGASSL
jgi:hypothetical protein